MPSLESTRSSSFAADVLKLVTGTTVAQVIAALASPLLTRLYGPEAFGFFAIFTSITSIIGVIACMRYELAIMLPKTDEEAANLLGLCLLCAAVVSGLTIPALYFGGDALLSLLRAPGLGLILVPPFVFISGVFLALNYWNSRTKRRHQRPSLPGLRRANLVSDPLSWLNILLKRDKREIIHDFLFSPFTLTSRSRLPIEPDHAHPAPLLPKSTRSSISHLHNTETD